jgi:hypothetical protein
VATYPIDIEPDQIVRWLLAEQEATPSLFRVDARVVREVRDIPPRSEYHLGDEEREDLSEVDTIATLEVRPANLSDGWALTISVEDETGPRAANQPGQHQFRAEDRSWQLLSSLHPLWTRSDSCWRATSERAA